MSLEKFISKQNFQTAKTEAERHGERVEMVDLSDDHPSCSLSSAVRTPSDIADYLLDVSESAISDIEPMIQAYGYARMGDLVRRGWWASSCGPMKPKSVEDCFRHMRGATGNFLLLLKVWLAAQPLDDICQFVTTEKQLNILRDIFESKIIAQALENNGPLLAANLEQDLGL